MIAALTIEFAEWKDGGEIAAKANDASKTVAAETQHELGTESYKPSEIDHDYSLDQTRK